MMRSSAVSVWRRGARKRVSTRSQLRNYWQKRVIITQILLFMILILGAVGLIIFYLLQGWQSTDLSKQISAGRIELQKARDEIQKLEFEVSGAFTVERIRKLATEELGMSEPKIEILTLPPLTK